MRLSLAILLATASVARAATYQVDTNLLFDWYGNLGVVGGIPTVTTLHSNIVTAGCDPTGIVDCAPILQAAFDNQPSNTYVLAPAGRYLLNSTVLLRKGVFRGQGTNTVLLPNHTGVPIWVNGGITPTHRTNIACSVERGGTNLWFSTPHSEIAPGFRVTASYFNNPDYVYALSPPEGPFTSNDNLHVSFIIKATNGNNAWIDPSPVEITTNAPAILMPHVWTRSVANIPAMVGMEDFAITNYSGNMIGASMVYFVEAHNVWVTNVSCYTPGPLTSVGGIWFHDVIHGTIIGCRVLDHTGTIGTDGITVSGSSHLCVVLNNACRGMEPNFMISENASTSGNAWLYNYGFAPYVSADPTWINASLQSHGHTAFNLVEGNVFEGYVHADGFHVSVDHNVIFRNWIKGKSSAASAVLRVKPISLNHYSYTNGIFGNVLGEAGVTFDEYEQTNVNYALSQSEVYELGFPDTGDTAYTGTRPPNSIQDRRALDWLVYSNTIRHANFDYKSNNWSNIAGQETNLPPSLYWTNGVFPSWFGSLPTPAHGPGVSGLTNRIPAMALIDGDWSFLNATPNVPRPPPLRAFRGFQ